MNLVPANTRVFLFHSPQGHQALIPLGLGKIHALLQGKVNGIEVAERVRHCTNLIVSHQVHHTLVLPSKSSIVNF